MYACGSLHHPVKMPTVFIVDDDPTIRMIIRTFLEQTTPFKVCGESGDGVTAIEKAPELKPDVVLLDLVMPRLNGVQTASVLKRLLPEIKIILFTFFDDIPGNTLATAAGVDAILSKSDGLKGIAETLQKVTTTLTQLEPLPNNATDPSKTSVAE